MARLLETGFETGDFSGLGVETNLGTAVVTTERPFQGIYSAHFHTDPSLAGPIARAVRPISRITDVYARGYFYIEQPLMSILGTWDRFALLRIQDTAGSYLVLAGIRREGTMPPRWCLYFRGGQVFGSIVDDSIVGKWICIEIHYSKAAGLIELYIDGNLAASHTMDTSALADPALVTFGIEGPKATGQYYDPTTQFPIDVFVDECVIADTYIGTYVPPPGMGAMEVHAYADSGEVAASLEVVGIGTFNTPVTVELAPGDYTLNCTYQGTTQTQSVTITSGQVTTANFQFVVVPPPKPCFIATAAYGSALAPEIGVLRSFRDRYLPKPITNTYYQLSPPIAKYLRQHRGARRSTRLLLEPIVKTVKKIV